MAADFTFGSSVWPGLSKLIEECGESLHEVGKIMGSPDDEILIENLEEEIADLIAAASVVIRLNPALNAAAINKRVKQKIGRHLAKHEERAHGNVCTDS